MIAMHGRICMYVCTYVCMYLCMYSEDKPQEAGWREVQEVVDPLTEILGGKWDAEPKLVLDVAPCGGAAG